MTSDETIRKAVKAAGDSLNEHGMEQCSHSAPGFHRRWIQCSCDEAVEYADVPAWEVHRAKEAVRALAEAGLLASLTEWDVEYRSDDGYVSRHTDDVFDETDLGYEQAKEYADAYNDLDSSPGVAVVVRRYVTDWEEA